MKNWVQAGIVIMTAFLMAACETTSSTPPPSLEGNVITDQALGFRGTRITLPDGYLRHMPLIGVPNAPENAQRAWETINEVNRSVPGFTLRYQFAFGTNDNRGISVAVVETIIMHPPPGEELGWERELVRLFTSAASGNPNADLRTNRKVGSYHVGQVGWKLPEEERYAAVHVVALPPGRLLVITGISIADQREALLRDLTAATESISPLR